MDPVQEIDMSECTKLHAWVHSGKCGVVEGNFEWISWLAFLAEIEKLGRMIPVALAIYGDAIAEISTRFSGRSMFMSIFCQSLMNIHVKFMQESCRLRLLIAPEEHVAFMKGVSKVISVITLLIQSIEGEAPRVSPYVYDESAGKRQRCSETDYYS